MLNLATTNAKKSGAKETALQLQLPLNTTTQHPFKLTVRLLLAVYRQVLHLCTIQTRSCGQTTSLLTRQKKQQQQMEQLQVKQAQKQCNSMLAL